MENVTTLSELEEAVLRYIQSVTTTHARIVKKFVSEGIKEAAIIKL